VGAKHGDAVITDAMVANALVMQQRERWKVGAETGHANLMTCPLKRPSLFSSTGA
jgi:hypothetical protein